MKSILIVMFGMGCGGAEKSLISCLNLLPQKKWNIDLAIANPHGMYMEQIPKYVHYLDDLFDFENLSTPLENRRRKIAGIRDFLNQVNWQCRYPIIKKRTTLSYTEIRWNIWGKHIPALTKEYDLVIAYINGIATYYAIDKVRAKKKAVWVHNEFEKMGYNKNFQRPYYTTADRIITISQDCVDSILRVYPEFREKTVVLENISSEKTIKALASVEIQDDLYFDFKGIKIVSIGRLTYQKGFDYAISAAKILKEKKIPFLWYVLGEGELRRKLEKQIIAEKIEKEFKLVGIKENPYPYIKACDIFAQTSRYEGKSIALDEAKILCKPILVTDYVTARASIKNGVNGLIVDLNPKAIADGLYKLIQNANKRMQFSQKLQGEKNGNESEIKKYIQLIDELLMEE